jgi:tartrate dehydratase alpha subunit/fumarate hydratase class I-like protein
MMLLSISKIIKCDVRPASKSTIVVPSFVKNGQVIRKLKLGLACNDTTIMSSFVKIGQLIKTLKLGKHIQAAW